jgi:hypothetical protein
MTQSFQIDSTDAVTCRFCGEPMRLFGIERDTQSAGVLLRTYECPHCKNLQTSTALVQPGKDRDGFLNPVFGLAKKSGFDDAALRLLCSAFETAWRIVETSGSPLAEDPKAARERLARCVIEQGMDGERAQARIVELALASLVAQTGTLYLNDKTPPQKTARV